jgi:hypothetical protein
MGGTSGLMFSRGLSETGRKMSLIRLPSARFGTSGRITEHIKGPFQGGMH